MLTDNNTFSIAQQALTALALVLVLALTYGLLLLADPVHRVLGKAGAEAVIRVLGLVLAALAVELLLEALQTAGLIFHNAG